MYSILAVNSCWEDLCGFSRAEAVGKTIKGLGFSSWMTNKAATRALTKDLEQGKPSAAYLRNQTKDGRIFANYLRATPLFDDEVSSASTAVAFLGVIEDVSTMQQHQHSA